MTPTEIDRMAWTAVEHVRFKQDGDNGRDFRNRKNRDATFKRYAVFLRGELIGHVVQEREHTYRKAGRLITRSWYPLCWLVDRPGWLPHSTRKQAAISLLVDHFRKIARKD